MKKPVEAKPVSDAALPQSNAMRQLPENKKKALELGDHAEHETGTRREILQKQAQEKAGR